VGSDGFDLTNEYSSNETVSDVLKSESTSDSWRLVYPTITSSLAMSADNPPPSPYWVAGPDLKMTSGHDIQFNYGGNLEDGFEGSYSETTGFTMESLRQDGTVDHYEYTLTLEETYPNTNDGDESGSSPESSDTVTATMMSSATIGNDELSTAPASSASFTEENNTNEVASLGDNDTRTDDQEGSNSGEQIVYPPSCPEINVDPAGRIIIGEPYYFEIRVAVPDMTLIEMAQAQMVVTGHTFIVLRPPANVEAKLDRNHYFGYYPNDGFLGTPGHVTYQDEHTYTHTTGRIPISKETHDLIAKYVVQVRRNPGTYSVLDMQPDDQIHHCTTFVTEALRKGGIDIYPEFGSGELVSPLNLVSRYKFFSVGGSLPSTAESARFEEWLRLMNELGPNGR
jgi:hypothetical protein